MGENLGSHGLQRGPGTPEDGWVEPGLHIGHTDEQALELQWWWLGFGDKVEVLTP